MNWIGPYTIDDLLDSFLEPAHPRPPEAHGVYLISEHAWDTQPTPACMPLYVGSNTGTSKRFCTRIGDLIADMFGFFGGGTGHHSGGQQLHSYCKERHVNPKSLYIGWMEDCACVRCAEHSLFAHLKPRLNRKTPPQCLVHLNAFSL